MLFNYLSTARKSKRSQSALEYMMTYGWAILIIVIVAVILYSMGIFNPSSSITTTSIGFSPFTVSSTVCSPAGLSVAIISGGLPDTETQATITKIYITSNTGTTALTKAYNLTKTAISPGKTATIVIPTVACTSANVKYSLSAKIQYSYSTPAGAVITNTTGTIAGTSSANPIVKYVPLTIASSTATPSPFQQMVIVNMNNYNSYASSNLSNIEFTYPNGTIIPSWRENGTSNSQTVVYWLKLGSFTTTTVYMDFFSTASNVLNTVNTGEAPQIPCGSTPTSSCSNYAEYDDGANVFYVYFNAKTSLSSFTQYDVSTLSQTTLNSEPVIYFSANSGYGWAGFSNPIPSSFIIDGWVYTTQAGDIIGFVGQAQTSSDSGYLFGGGTGAGGTYVSISKISNGGLSNLANTGSENENSWEYAQVSYNNGNIVISGGDAPQSFSYTTSASDTTYTSGYVGIGESGSDNYNYYRYMFVRAYPPNGVMPSVTFGSIS
jgi:hypothetical protein